MANSDKATETFLTQDKNKDKSFTFLMLLQQQLTFKSMIIIIYHEPPIFQTAKSLC